MLKKVVLTSICFLLISGCGLMETSEVDVESQNTAHPASTPQAQPAVKESASVAQPRDETNTVATKDKSVGVKDVKRIQAYLNSAGFFSGSVDGVLNTDTQTAIQRFQSVCVTLKDLMRNADERETRPSFGTAMAKVGVGKNKGAGTSALRLVQLRLKDAGFDPGPIDGIDGPKTQSALLAMQSGCRMLDSIPILPVNGAHAPKDDSAVNATKVSALIQRATDRGSEESTESNTENSVRGAIKALQMRLREAGFDPGRIDGMLGPRTIAAAQNYQSSLR
jgi:peptidoglycan hydrolase-like protein with peptidoglycan-binding domain